MNRILLIIYVFCWCFSTAQVVKLNGKIDVSVNGYIEVYTANSWTQNTEKQGVNYGFDNHKGICRFSVQNTDIAQNYTVSIQQSRIDSTLLIINRFDNTFDTLSVIHKALGISQRPVYSVSFAYPIFLEQNEKAIIYIKSSRMFGSHSAIVRVQSENKFDKSEINFTAYISFISGICLIISLAGLFLYLFFKSKMYLIYSLYCLCSFFVTNADAGFFHSYLPSKNLVYVHNNITTIAFYLVIGMHIYLTVVLLRLKKQESFWLYCIGTGLTLCFLTLGLILFIPNLNAEIRSLTILFSYYIVFIMDLYILIALLSSIRRKQIYVYFYLFGFVFSIVASTTLILANIGVIDDVNQNYDFGYAIPLVEIFCMLIGISFQFSSQNKLFLHAQQELNDAQNQLITIQETQQIRIAQDLHDGIGQEMLILKQSLAKNEINMSFIENIIENIRKVSRELYPVSLFKIGLKEAIENLASQIMLHHSIFVSVDFTINTQLSKNMELQIYRIVQEGINNTIKHAEAIAVLIQLSEDNSFVNLLIKDNGKGFDIKKTSVNNNSFGLNSITQRTKSLKGNVEFQSDSKGTCIIVKIPIGDV